MKKQQINSIAFRTGINSFAGFTMVMILLVSLFLWSMTREFKSYILTENEQRVLSIIQMLDQNLQEYQKDLQVNADNSTLVNAVMNPVNTDYYIPDYIKGLSIRNIPAELSLVTFDGMVIYSTFEEYLPGETYPALSDQISHSENGKNISILNDTADIGLTGEVRYNGFVEGYLLMKVNFRTIFNINLNFLKLQSRDHNYSASYKGVLLSEKTENGAESLTTYHTLKTLPIDIHVSTPMSIINDPVKKLLFQMLLIASVASFAATAFLSFISGKIMVKPLLLLEQGIKNISSGKWEELRINSSNVREIQYLSTSFNRMQSSLQRRTNQLEKSNTELQLANQNLKTAQKQLIHSEKMASIGQLAAGVAHEINNPTGFITTNLTTMSEYLEVYNQLIEGMEALKEAVRSGDPGKAEKVIEKIEAIEKEEDLAFIKEDVVLLLQESSDGARRIKEIVLGLKNFARPDGSEMKNGNINSAIEDALKLTWNEIKYKCEVIKELADLPDISCRTDQLTQVFVNLLINAEHAIKDHGKIIIKSYLEQDEIIVKVCDTGEGIPEEHLDKLFDPFFTTKKIGKGTGLGLSISHGIIQEHGGEITARNAQGGGSCFMINIPVSREPVPEGAGSQNQ